MSCPLEGIRVLDLSRVLAGPWASQMLADYGADVIKIERPRMGDDTRHWGPPFLRDRAGRETGESAYYLSANRGKRSVTIDISRRRGQELIRALAARADVLLENFKAGALAARGLDYPRLRALNPGLVYCSITGFGQDGPQAQAPGYDAIIQAMGGLMSITGVPPGEPGAGPVKVGVAVADLMTGMYAVTAVLAALLHRRESGEGQHIDLALLDTQLAWLANQSMNYLIGGQPPRHRGTAHPNIAPYQAFATADGHLMLAVGNDVQFRSFCQVAGLEELARDPRFETNALRVQNRAALIPRVQAALHARPGREWLRLFAESKVPAGRINDLAQAFAEPQIQHRGMRIDLPHPLAGTVPGVANPVRFSATPVEYRRAPPLLGADTDSVLQEILGLDEQQIATLHADRIV